MHDFFFFPFFPPQLLFSFDLPWMSSWTLILQSFLAFKQVGDSQVSSEHIYSSTSMACWIKFVLFFFDNVINKNRLWRGCFTELCRRNLRNGSYKTFPSCCDGDLLDSGITERNQKTFWSAHNFGVTLYLSKTWGGGGMAPALMQRGDPAFISTLWPPCDSSEDCHTPWWQTGLLCTASTGCHPRLWLGTFWKCQSHMIMNIKQPCIAHDYLTGGGDLTDAGERNLIVSRNDAWGYWAG